MPDVAGQWLTPALDNDGLLIDFNEMLVLRREAVWDFVVSLPGQFATAAESNPWVWLVLVAIVATASFRAWTKLARFVGGAYLRQSFRD